jgi:hypothetical protein
VSALVGRVAEGPTLLFDRATLETLADRRRAEYAAARPFPHVVLDDFLPAAAAARVAEEFPPIEVFEPDDPEGGNKIGKFNSTAATPLGAFTRHLLGQLSCAPFTDFLERLSGVPGLVADPRGVDSALRHYAPGGRLAVHADFNQRARLGLERRVNLILYLNARWPEEYGGALELWDARLTGCVTRVAPVFNRMIVFTLQDDGYHGFPDPVRCPAGESRRSLQLYYFAVPRAGVAPHSTLWRRPPSSLARRLRRRVERWWWSSRRP